MDISGKQNTLSFFGHQLKLDSEEEIEKVVNLISKHANLEILDFRGNTISVDAGKRIAEALKKRKELRECLWSDMFTGRLKHEIPLVLDYFGEALTASRCHLTTLDLSDNAFGAGLRDSLFNFLQSPALFSLENLILNNNGLGLAGETVGEALCELIATSRKEGRPLKLKKFVCGRNRLEIVSTIALTNAFIMMKTLEEIRLPQNGIGGEAIKALAQAFAANPNLRVIDINDNFVCPEGALELAEVLPELHHIQVLDLGDCVCDDPGVVAILSGLDRRRDCLQKVVLSGNNITSDVIDAIGDFFNSARMSHVHVDISFNMFGEDFDSAKARHGRGNIDFGRRGDDELLSSDGEEQGAEDASMEEGQFSDVLNTSGNTVIERSPADAVLAENMMNEMLTRGFGCFKISDSDQSAPNGGLVTFLDKSLKLDTAESAEQVVKLINSAKTMKALELRGNTLGIAAGNVIAKALEKHPELERCLWSDLFTGRLKNEIPPILEALGKAMIKAGCKIRELDLSDNAFGPIGADALKEFLESPSAYTLEVLKLNNNGLGVGGKQIAKSLTECLRKSIAVGGENRLRLKTFVAGRNRLENPGAHALAATFKSLETVEWFDVRQNGIHEEGIRALVTALKHNRNLRHLWLEDNTVLPKGAKALARALESWPKLEVLNLSDCLLRDAGCNYVIDHLNPQLHRHLKHVYLCGNELTPPVAKLLIQKWIQKFDGFTPKPTLHIHTNSFGDEFDEVAAMAPDNVNVGDVDDDLGSLDGDQEEYNSKSSDSDDADLDSDGDDVVSDDDDDDDDDGVQVIETIDHLKQAMDRIDQLDIDFESRFQEDTARVILQLSAPLKSCGMSLQAFGRAVEVAENIVKRVEAVKRNPIPATTQLINNIVAQCQGTGVKAESDWGYNADTQVISRLLAELVKRGHFEHEKPLIERFFPSK